MKRTGTGWCVGLVLFGLGGCAAVSNEPARLTLEEPRVTCAQALRASRDALRRLGYTIEEVVPESGDAPGRVVAVRHAGWTAADPSGAGSHRATALVRCGDAGATVTAEAGGEAMERMRFPGAFGEAFRQALESDRPRPAAAAARPEGSGLAVAVVPLAPGEASPFAAIDPLAAGILPVRIEIANRTERRYRFDPATLRLTTVGGERRAPLTAAELQRRLGAAADAAAALREAAIAAGEVGAGEVRRGYVYVDAATYGRAAVTLTEVESGESEGFSVRF